MNKPTVSVIIPVYNAERYLPECIASLRGQSLQEMEFLFVDDGSRDGSARLLEDAARQDERIRVLSLGENQGVSAARNAGIAAAAGDFIGFCDADDTAEPVMYERLWRACVENEADVSFCRVFKDEANRTLDVPLGFMDGTRMNRAAIRTGLIPAMLAKPKDGDGLPLSGYTPRNLFRAEIAKAHRFREDIRYAEDLLYIVECLLDADAAVAVDQAYYHYRFHGESVTKRYSPFVPESFERSNDALTMLLGGSSACMARMKVRRRKMAVDVVRNLCAAGSPYSPLARVREARRYMAREDVIALFDGLSLRGMDRRAAIRLGLMKYRLPVLSCLLYSTVFQLRA